ncbi:MAG: aminotransferase class I/II-fold pyridoxal phosphate-dependent enzyme [Alphaproteobacteria bacterium]|nr:aminotransferase class I/II-fold pyridoxal phosphate-dependent enzyme [Alphaproteobacteria bacterium]
MTRAAIASRIGAIPVSGTVAIADRIRDLISTGQPIVNLTSGAPDFETPAPIREAAAAALGAGVALTSYVDSQGLPELRQAIGSVHAAATADIVVTVGSKEAIFAACHALLAPGDEVIVPSPAWMTYDAAIRMCRAEPVPVALIREDGEARLVPAAIERAVTTRTAAVVLCNPHNPTGLVLAPDVLQAIASIATRHDLLLLVDESLSALVYDGRPFMSARSILPARDRVVTFHSFSKSYSMTGWRVGYAIAPSDLAQSILRAHQNIVTCVPGFLQRAALAAIENCAPERDRLVAILGQRRRALAALLDAIPGIRCPAPQGGLFCFPNISDTGMDDREFTRFCLDRAAVAVLPGAVFGPGGEGHVRIAFGRKDGSDLDRAARQIREAMGHR